MSETPRVLARDEVFALARWHEHVLVVWHLAADEARAERVAEATVRATRAAPGKAAHIAWVQATSGAPDADARKVFTKMGRDVGADLACMLAVVGDDGFKSALFRSVITGLALAARIRFPLKLIAGIDEGAAWAAERLGERGVTLAAPELATTLRRLGELARSD